MKELTEEMRNASLQWGQRENQLVARTDLLTALLDSCYDAICNAVYDDDGLDGAKGGELLEKIKETIGMTPNVKSWEPEHSERKSQFSYPKEGEKK